MKLRGQILSIGLAGAGIAALVGAAGLFSASRLADAFDGSLGMGLAVQNSQRAAMMHGAVRGDVQRAMLGAIGRDKAQIAEARQALDVHVRSFDAALQTLEGLPLSAQAKAAIGNTLPMVKAYTDSAADLLQLTTGDSPAAAAAAVPRFQKLFNELETQMAVQVDAIARDEKAFGEHSKAVVVQARIAVGAALVLATLVLTLAALGLASRMARPMSHAVEVARRLARGNLSVPITPAGNDETVQLLRAMEEMQANIGAIVQRVQSSAHSVAAASGEIAQGNQDLSARTEMQAGSLEETAASMEQLSATVKQNAERASRANQLAVRASAVATEGGDVVAQVVETMHAINDSSGKISDIVSLVAGIAAQTNILALNAAVEAARAGEQGRGFAVVALEVRNLAGRCTDAVKEISALINASVERVGLGSTLVNQAGAAMTEVVRSIRRVADIMGEISGASVEQSAGVSQVGKAVTDMDAATQRNAALVEQIAASAGSLKLQADELVQAVAVFELGTESGAAAMPHYAARGSSASPCATSPPEVTIS